MLANGRAARSSEPVLEAIAAESGLCAFGRNGHRSAGPWVFEAAGALSDYPCLTSRIATGKRILYLAERRGPFTGWFTPPRGVVCHRFAKLVLGTQCPYDCAYCYLQVTYRMLPCVRLYLNLEALYRELRALNDALREPVLLNAGELADPLALEPAAGVIREVLEMLRDLPRLHLLLLTKSAGAYSLPKLSAALAGRVIVSASLTTEANRERLEHGTPSVARRIAALRAAAARGYRVRVRLDPIVRAEPDGLEGYGQVVEEVLDTLPCEVVTLGQPRFYPSTFAVMRRRFPEAAALLSACGTCATADGRVRASEERRLEVYRDVLGLIRAHPVGRRTPVALCKEEPALFRALGLSPRTVCNCLLR